MADSVDRQIMDWASGAAAQDIADPGIALEESGYAFQQLVPNDELNYILRSLSKRSPYFGSITELAQTLEAGLAGMVNAYDPAKRIADEEWVVTGSAIPDSAAFDGRYFWVAGANLSEANKIGCYDPVTGELVTSVGTDGWISPPSETTAMFSDGVALFVACDDDTLYKYNAVDGSAYGGSWVDYDHGAAIESIYSEGSDGYVFIAGATGTGTYTHRALSWTTGTPAWSQNHGASVFSIISDGESVWIGGNVGTGTYTDRHLTRSTGVVATSYDHGATVYAHAFDENNVFVGGVSGSGGYSVRSHQKGAYGTVDWNIGAPGDVRALVWDGLRLWVGSSEDGTGETLHAYDVTSSTSSATLIREVLHGACSGAAEGCRYLFTDGVRVYSATNEVGTPTDKIFCHYIPKRAALFQRFAGSERYRFPWHHLISPADVVLSPQRDW